MNRRSFLKLASGAASAAALPAPILAAAPAVETFAIGVYTFGPGPLYLVGEDSRETLISTITHVKLIGSIACLYHDYTITDKDKIERPDLIEGVYPERATA